MIQRLQSILLLLAAALNLPVLFMKLGDASSNASMESPSIHFYGMKFVKEYLNEMEGKFMKETLPLGDNMLLLLHMILVIGAVALAVGAVFLYKNRKLQLRVSLGALLLIMVQILISIKIFMDLPQMVQAQEGDPHDFGIALFFPALSVLLIWWATRRIQRDEKLVKDMDRIR